MLKKLTKYTVTTLIAILACNAQAYTINNQSAKNLFSAYGYLYAQNLYLQRIGDKFPQLNNQIQAAKIRFDSAFPNLSDNLMVNINSITSDSSKIKSAFNEGETNAQKYIYSLPLSYKDALNFIETVNYRAKGNIDSPILENILSVQFDKNPNNEMVDGFYNRYSSLGHNKAKGIEVNLKIPKSWAEKEAERPNIVRKWINQNGSGHSSIMLFVKDAGGLNPSLNDIKDMYNNGEMSDIANDDGMETVDPGYPIVLDRQNGFYFKAKTSQQYMNMHFYAIFDQYLVFYNGKSIAVMCGTTVEISNKDQADEANKKMAPLCKSVANSIIFPQQYK